MAAGKVDLVVTYGVIPGTTDPFKIGTSGEPYLGSGDWEDMSDAHQESRRIIHSNDGPFTLTRDSNQVKIAFSFMTVQTSAENLKKEIQLIETVFSQKWQDVKLSINGEDQYDFSHTNATGFESSASISKGMSGSSRGIDGSFTRNYKVAITVGLPHDQIYATGVGAVGLANSTVGITFNSDNKKTVTIAGAYSAMPVYGSPAYENPGDASESTQTGADGITGSIYARDQYENQINDYCAAVLTSIDSTAEFDVAYESTDVKDSVLTTAGIAKGKMITFSRKYVELFFQEGPTVDSGKTFAYAKIRDQSLSVTPKINRSAAMGRGCKSTYGVPLVSANVTYLCTFNRMEFEDDSGDKPDYLKIEDMKEQYDLLRPWLIEKVKESMKDTAKTESGGFFVMSENVGYNCDAYKITATLQVAALAQGGPSRFVARSVTYNLVRNHGKTLIPIWDKNSSFSRYLFQGAASRTLTMTESWKYIGSDQDMAILWEEPNWKDFAPDKNWKWVVKITSKDFTPLKQGIAPDDTKAGEYQQRITVEYYTSVGTAATRRGQTIVAKKPARDPGAGLGLQLRGNGKKFGGD